MEAWREACKFLSAMRKAGADLHREEQASMSRKMPFLKPGVPMLPLCFSSYCWHVEFWQTVRWRKALALSWSKPLTLPTRRIKSQWDKDLPWLQLYNGTNKTEAGSSTLYCLPQDNKGNASDCLALIPFGRNIDFSLGKNMLGNVFKWISKNLAILNSINMFYY